MSRRFITVLYEDQLAPGTNPNNYGPHALLLACVADTLGKDRRALEHKVRSNPKKGDSKLRATLRDVGSLIADNGPIVAMFDLDRVRACYQLPQNACKSGILDAIRVEATGAPSIVLLKDNLEDVVKACCAALNRPFPSGKPTPAERDAKLHHAADEDRTVRDAVLRSVKDFARLVRVVSETLRAMPE